MMEGPLEALGLEYNPFEPSASGVPIGPGDLWMPASWQERLRDRLDRLRGSQGVRALALIGTYGTGKTYILRWLERVALPERRIEPFYFDNPGVQFYEVANQLMRQIGRKDFAKALWELARDHLDQPYQRNLFADGYEGYLSSYSRRRGPDLKTLTEWLQGAIRRADITRDDEIAHRLARVVTELPQKPYFEYRDFIAGRQGALVPERREAEYFAALLAVLRKGRGIDAAAFLMDEFEEVALQKRLTRRAAHDYLQTLTHLVSYAENAGLWLVVAMTHDAVTKTKELEPKLWERFTSDGEYEFQIDPLRAEEAVELIGSRLKWARAQGSGLYPFPEDTADILSRSTLAVPRRVVKVCFYAVSEWAPPAGRPFDADYLREVERKAYPPTEKGGDEG